MAKHRRDAPIVGDGKTSNPANKPAKAQISQKADSGRTLLGQTSKLWGVFSGKKK